MNSIDGFLVGIILAMSLVASAHFFKFWNATRDQLFLAFAIAMAIEGVTRLFTLLNADSYEGAPVVYVVRLVAYLIILAAIFRKNRRSQGDRLK